MTRPLDLVLERLDGVRPSGDNWTAHCPGPIHDNGDRNSSLSLREAGDGRVLWNCHRPDCATDDALAAVGLNLAHLFPEAKPTPATPPTTYDYHDEAGTLVGQVVRKPPKKFVQRRPDGNGGWEWKGFGPRLYRLPQLVDAVDAGRVVFIVEGEKDVDRLRGLGLAATCNVGGAGNWKPGYREHFGGAKVVILPDNDEPGRAHAADVAASLLPVAEWVRVLELPDLPPKGDVSDWLAAGHDRHELEVLVKGAPDLDDAALLALRAKPDGGEQAAHKGSGLQLVRASTIVPQPVRFLWEPRFPLGEVTLVLGVGGHGKTLMLAADLAARVTLGTLDGDLDGPAGVIIASAEDSLDHTLVPRLIAAGADLDRVHFVTSPATLPDDTAALEQAVKDTGAALVILDPIVSFLGDSIDSHKDHSVRRALSPLSRMAQELHVAVTPILHLNKARSSDLFTRASGSGAFWNAVRSAVAVTEDPSGDTDGDDGRRILWHGKANLAQKAAPLRFTVTETSIPGPDGEIVVPVVEWGEEATGLLLEDALDKPSAEDRSATVDAATWLEEQLADGARPVSAIQSAAQTAGHAWRTVQRAKRQMGVVSERTQFGGPYSWRLPKREQPRRTSSGCVECGGPTAAVDREGRSFCADHNPFLNLGEAV